MKLINQCLLGIIMAAITAFSACKKTDNNAGSTLVTTPDKSNVTLYSALRSAPQSFTVNAGISSKIKGAQGTLLQFYPNSFKDKNGVTITSGAISIQLIEMYTAGDMIANRTSTVTSLGLLTSGGEVSIKASMAGQEVFANSYRLGFKAPAPATAKPMELYYAGEKNADSITTWTRANGSQAMSVTGSSYVTDTSWSLIEAPYFMFDSCTSFNMINCDHPYNSTSKLVTISVVFPDNTFKTAYGTLCLAYSSLNIATCMGGYQFNTSTHTMTFQGWVPTDSSCKFILTLPRVGDSWCYFEQTGSITGDMSISANPVLMLKTDIANKIKAL